MVVKQLTSQKQEALELIFGVRERRDVLIGEFKAWECGMQLFKHHGHLSKQGLRQQSQTINGRLVFVRAQRVFFLKLTHIRNQTIEAIEDDSALL